MKKVLVLLLALIVLAAVPAIGYSADTVTGCIQKGSGLLRIVGSAADCKNSETSITFNETGPAGPRGPIGPSGLSGYELVLGGAVAQEMVPYKQEIWGGALCPQGKRLLSGGAYCLAGDSTGHDAGKTLLTESMPTSYEGAPDSSNLDMWSAACVCNDPDGCSIEDGNYFAIDVRAICVDQEVQ